MSYVYFTATLDAAVWGAELAAGEGRGRIYVVEPTGAFEDDPTGWPHEGALLSPWRVIVLARNLNDLVNSDFIPALCDPPDATLFPEGMNTKWIRPGKAPCTWMVYGNDGAQWDRQKWFVDVAAATGCEYLLVDAGWRTEKWGWLKDGGDLWARAAELVRYAAARNVGIFLCHAYPDGRDDGSAAKSPPPMTLPALAEATPAPPGPPPGRKKERR